MEITPMIAGRARSAGQRFVVSLLAGLVAVLALLLGVGVGPAMAESTDPPSSEQPSEVGLDENPFRVSGNVKLNSEPLAGVHITVTGGGYTADVYTDAEGQWRVGVPEKETYTVILDEQTLPEGIAVIDEADETPNEKEAEIGPSGRVTMNFFIGRGERNTVSFFDQLVERLVNGLNFGLMLGLAAIGLSLVFGTTGISNFAHAEMVTFGAVAALFFVGFDIPIWAAIPLAIAASAAFGLTLDAGLWRPLRRRGVGVVQLMIVSIGLSLAVRYVFQFFIGGGTEQLPGNDSPTIQLFGAVQLSVIDLVSMGLSVLVIVAFSLWLLYTRMGKATRAISDNPSLAAASGIDVDGVVRVVWVVAAALAGLAGVLYAYYRPGIRWDMGAQILLLLFAAVTLGGLGTAFGALIGAIIVGVLTEVSSLWIPADLRFAAALVVLILILLLRPQGILGRRSRIG